MDLKEILFKLTGFNATSGDEHRFSEEASKLLSLYGNTTTDHFGNIVCALKRTDKTDKHILLDAHFDEIGFMVVQITEDGFLKVANVGGFDKRLLYGLEVTVHGKEDLYGVFCSTPPHLVKNKEDYKKVPDFDSVYIDIGFSGERAKELVSLGDRVTTRRATSDLVNSCVSGKAMDDRAGCAILIKAAELIRAMDIDVNVSVLLSAQEEVGGAGAKTGTFAINPTHAIAVDVGHAYTPDAPRDRCGDIGKGAMIGFAPILSNKVTNDLVEICKEENIPYQYDVMGGRTGTNADHIAISQYGVETGLISIPLKYMHTPVEVASLHDLDCIANLIAEYVKRA